jgi:membrane protease YdiL (CAAX protease family)
MLPARDDERSANNGDLVKPSRVRHHLSPPPTSRIAPGPLLHSSAITQLIVTMKTRTITQAGSWLLALCLATNSLGATSDADFGVGSHERFVARVNGAQTTDYDAVLALYDQYQEAHPDDVASRIEKCRFIEPFAWSDVPTIQSSPDDLNDCRERLRSGPLKDQVEIILYGIESEWGEESTTEAKALIPQSKSWSKPQRAKLYELLALRTQWNEPELSAMYATNSVSLDPGSKVLVQALRSWVQMGLKDKVRRVIGEVPESSWGYISRVQVAQVLVDIDEAFLAQELLGKAPPDKLEPGANLLLARAFIAKGDFEKAAPWFRKAVTDVDVAFLEADTLIEYFKFECDHGTAETAAAAYEKLRAPGFGADSLARYRLALFVAHPGAGWQWRDAGALLALLAALLLLGALPVLVIVPVHYRGLALRVAGRQPTGFTSSWTLREAYYAFGSFMFIGFAFTYVFAMPYLEVLMPWVARTAVPTIPDTSLARILLWSTVVSFLALLPLLRGRSIKTLLLGRWSITGSILRGIGFALALNFVANLIGRATQSASLLGSDTVRAIQGAHEMWGWFGMLMLIAVLTPIIEEFVFRGALLQAFRERVSFLFATVTQAAAFALMHEEWQNMPYLFVFALITAAIARRSEGLLAPMVMHATNNAIAAASIIGVTRLLNSF